MTHDQRPVTHNPTPTTYNPSPITTRHATGALPTGLTGLPKTVAEVVGEQVLVELRAIDRARDGNSNGSPNGSRNGPSNGGGGGAMTEIVYRRGVRCDHPRLPLQVPF